MRRKATISVILVAFIAGGFFLALSAYSQSRRQAIAAGVWSDNYVSEMRWQFISRRIEQIIEDWQEAGRWAKRQSSDAPDIELVVDAAKPGIWVEVNGSPVETRKLTLPKGLKWSVYYVEPGQVGEMTTTARFMIRTKSTGSHLPEIVYLVGQDKSRDYISAHFDADSQGLSRSSGVFNWVALAKSVKFYSDGEEDRKPSIVVSQEEHLKTVGAAGARVSTAQGGFPWERDWTADWSRAEEAICRRIDAEAVSRKLDIRVMRFESSPSGAGGYAEMSMSKESFFTPLFGRTWLRRLFGRSNHYSVEYKFGHLGEGVWYARSQPIRIAPRNSDTDFDFVVTASGEAPSDSEAWLKKGREAKDDGAPAQVPWGQALDIGSKVELIGVCEYPSAGKNWWGPDGTALDYVPCYSRPFPIGSGPTGRAYQIAVRIKEARPTRMRFEGWLNEVSPAFDVYGRWVEGVQVYVFEWRKPEESVSVTVGYGRDESSGYEEVDFEKISLVPGKNGGFEIKHRPAAK